MADVVLGNPTGGLSTYTGISRVVLKDTNNNNVTFASGGGQGLADLVSGVITAVSAQDLSGITAVRDEAFAYCINLETVVFPEGVVDIGGGVFADCYMLRTVDFPSTVESFGGTVFGGFFPQMESITVRATTPPQLFEEIYPGIGITSLADLPIDTPIYVPAASVAAYRAATGWSDRAVYIQAIQ